MNANRGSDRARATRAVTVMTALCALAIGLLLAPEAPADAKPPGGVASRLSAIQPGRHPALHLVTPVNLVFVGYQPTAVDVPRILSQLPSQGDPTVRDASFLNHPQDVGLRYDYRYIVRFAGHAFNDAFFGYLATSGVAGPIDPIQQLYNEQRHNVVDVGPQERYIDAPSTEAWLERQSHLRLGLDPGQDTVFLVNWHGRADFQFHTFTHSGHPDPDTGVDGGNYVGSLTRAWGGSSGPTWFYDLSAGPVYTDVSWDVDDPDYTADGVTDYRIPPIWEYGNTSGYRPFTDLSGDLARVIRYVAIDMLFTPSPIYDPAATVPGPDGEKDIAMDIFEGDPARGGRNDVHPEIIRAQAQSLEPYYRVGVDVRDMPLAGDVLTAYNTAIGSANPTSCLTQFALPDAVLYCLFRDHRSDYFPSSGHDGVIPVAAFTLPDNRFDTLFGIGETDDDWSTGAPSFIYEADTEFSRDTYFYAYTDTTIHEAGHYVGLSHPHDGYDSTSGVDIEPQDAFGYAWTGDESATVMSYTLGNGLSYDAFDRDNVARWQVARLLDLANTDTAAILAHPHSGQIDLQLIQADAAFRTAVIALHLSNWIAAATAAAAGYRNIQRADISAGITSASSHLARAHAATTSRTANTERPGTNRTRPFMIRINKMVTPPIAIHPAS